MVNNHRTTTEAPLAVHVIAATAVVAHNAAHLVVVVIVQRSYAAAKERVYISLMIVPVLCSTSSETRERRFRSLCSPEVTFRAFFSPPFSCGSSVGSCSCRGGCGRHDGCGYWRSIDEVFHLWSVLLHVCLLPLELLQQPDNVRVSHVEARLAHAVLDVHVGKLVGEHLAGLALTPVSRSVQRSPAVEVLRIHLRSRLQEQAVKQNNVDFAFSYHSSQGIQHDPSELDMIDIECRLIVQKNNDPDLQKKCS